MISRFWLPQMLLNVAWTSKMLEAQMFNGQSLGDGKSQGSRRAKVQYVINYDAPANMEEPVMNLDKMEHVILPDMLQVPIMQN